MDLRGKLATIFLVLLVLPFIAVSAFQIDRTMQVMVDDLAESGKLIANQAFEQIREGLAHATGDPIAAIRADEPLRALLDSSQAFGSGVVYARVEAIDGTDIVAAHFTPSVAAIAKSATTASIVNNRSVSPSPATISPAGNRAA